MRGKTFISEIPDYEKRHYPADFRWKPP